MTPAEKAYDLVLKFQFKQEGIRKELAKRSALIAVDEILNQDKGAFDLGEINYHFEYWWNVKEEIEKL